MNPPCSSNARRARGFTLIEVVVVFAIIVTVAGILYTALGPSREKARQSVCLSNLRQIGQAVAMYRADYGGSDTPASVGDFGLPSTRTALLKYTSGSKELFQCPDALAGDPVRRISPPDDWCAYGWNIWGTELDSRLGPWTEAVAQRGGSFPLLYDINHDHPAPDRPRSQQFVLLLRLDGSVQGRHVSLAQESWKW